MFSAKRFTTSNGKFNKKKRKKASACAQQRGEKIRRLVQEADAGDAEKLSGWEGAYCGGK